MPGGAEPVATRASSGGRGARPRSTAGRRVDDLGAERLATEARVRVGLRAPQPVVHVQRRHSVAERSRAACQRQVESAPPETRHVTSPPGSIRSWRRMCVSIRSRMLHSAPLCRRIGPAACSTRRPSSGARAARRLREEIVGWLTTVVAGRAAAADPGLVPLGRRPSLRCCSTAVGKRKLAQHRGEPERQPEPRQRRPRGRHRRLLGEPPASRTTRRPTRSPPMSRSTAARIARSCAGRRPTVYAQDFSVPLRLEISRVRGH